MKGIIFIDIKRMEDQAGRYKKMDTTSAEEFKGEIIKKTSHLRCPDHPYHTSFITITPLNETAAIESMSFCCNAFERIIIPIIK